MMKNVNRLGFYSAVLAFIFGVSYVFGEVANQVGILGPDVSTNTSSLIIRMLPSLFLAPSFVVLMVSLYHYSSEEKKIWGHIGLSFAIIYAVLVSIVYFVEIALVIPYIQRGAADQIELLLFRRDTFMFALDILGYGFMNLATLFVAPVFKGKIRWALVANGILFPTNLLLLTIPEVWALGSLWAITFPVVTAMLAFQFKRGAFI